MGEKVAILDAGAQYCKVIDRRVRELNVESVIVAMNSRIEDLLGYKAVIISGGPASVYDADAPKYDPRIFTDAFCNENGKIPILGICYGMQLANYHFGGKVEPKIEIVDGIEIKVREDGQDLIRMLTETSPLLRGLSLEETVLLTHGDSCTELAPRFVATSISANGIIASFEDADSRIYGVQFHPEVDLTPNGKRVMRNFLYDIAGCKGDFSIGDRKEIAVDYIRSRAGKQQVKAFVSGGVDSTVGATLTNKALGPENVDAIIVDNGFLREGEIEQVLESASRIGMKVRPIYAVEEFANATTTMETIKDGQKVTYVTKRLNRAVDPQEKRNIIGDYFMIVAMREMGMETLESPSAFFFFYGTLRPDLIESASKIASAQGTAEVIKTHHNDTKLVRALREKGLVIEPLTEYHKDEVRQLGERLGLPQEIVWRQPFPGPGLAVRILCAEEPYVTPQFDEINARLKDEFSKDGVYATLLPIRSVGVQGDGRSYSYAACLSGKQDWEKLYETAGMIPKRIRQVNRVVYAFGDTVDNDVIDVTVTHLTPEVIEKERRADAIVNRKLVDYGLIRPLSQVPVVLTPVNFGNDGDHSVVIRTFITNDFMTGVPAIPGREMPLKCLYETVEQLRSLNGVARVLYDLTSKPPGTTEWE